MFRFRIHRIWDLSATRIRILKEQNIDQNHQKIRLKLCEEDFFVKKGYYGNILFLYKIINFERNKNDKKKNLKFSILGQIQGIMKTGSGAQLSGSATLDLNGGSYFNKLLFDRICLRI